MSGPGPGLLNNKLAVFNGVPVLMTQEDFEERCCKDDCATSINRAECLSPAQRKGLDNEIQETVKQAERLSPRDVNTVYLQARLAEMHGQWDRSIDFLLSSLRIDPDSPFAYVRAWDNSANLPRAAQEEVLNKLEERLLLSVGPLHHARTLALNVAARMGVNYAIRMYCAAGLASDSGVDG